MKKRISLLLLLFLQLQTMVNAQSASPEDQAQKVTQRLSDSLSLSPLQRDNIYNINLSLINQSRAIFSQQPADSVQPRLQRVENSRDRLYLPVLGNEKYLLYKQKKRVLLLGQ